jgi:oxaloacetate decarboxylase (Na+ extruding) subunit alpha
VSEGDVLIVLEAMKMETEIRAARNGVIQELHVKEGDSVSVGSPILSLA